jgi:hypothetical protein
MIDTTTRKPLHVSSGSAMPILRLPFSQVPEVEQVLKARGIRYWVGEQVISFNGGPEQAMIFFGHAGDREAIQAALDSIP